MKMFDEFLKAKEDHIIDRYAEDEESGLECTETHNTREVKKMYVEELVDDILHHEHHDKKQK